MAVSASETRGALSSLHRLVGTKARRNVTSVTSQRLILQLVICGSCTHDKSRNASRASNEKATSTHQELRSHLPHLQRFLYILGFAPYIPFSTSAQFRSNLLVWVRLQKASAASSGGTSASILVNSLFLSPNITLHLCQSIQYSKMTSRRRRPLRIREKRYHPNRSVYITELP